VSRDLPGCGVLDRDLLAAVGGGGGGGGAHILRFPRRP
jgi:hypothetical protein